MKNKKAHISAEKNISHINQLGRSSLRMNFMIFHKRTALAVKDGAQRCVCLVCGASGFRSHNQQQRKTCFCNLRGTQNPPKPPPTTMNMLESKNTITWLQHSITLSQRMIYDILWPCYKIWTVKIIQQILTRSSWTLSLRTHMIMKSINSGLASLNGG